MCFLGLAQCNASMMSLPAVSAPYPRCGGFTTSQNSKKVVFLHTIAGGLKVDVSENGLHIIW